MAGMAFDLGSSEIIIIVLIALVLFGGSRLAGLGKSAGRAIREFKEETSGSTSGTDEAAVTGVGPAPDTVPDHEPGPRSETRPDAQAPR